MSYFISLTRGGRALVRYQGNQVEVGYSGAPAPVGAPLRDYFDVRKSCCKCNPCKCIERHLVRVEYQEEEKERPLQPKPRRVDNAAPVAKDESFGLIYVIQRDTELWDLTNHIGIILRSRRSIRERFNYAVHAEWASRVFNITDISVYVHRYDRISKYESIEPEDILNVPIDSDAGPVDHGEDLLVDIIRKRKTERTHMVSSYLDFLSTEYATWLKEMTLESYNSPNDIFWLPMGINYSATRETLPSFSYIKNKSTEELQSMILLYHHYSRYFRYFLLGDSYGPPYRADVVGDGGEWVSYEETIQDWMLENSDEAPAIGDDGVQTSYEETIQDWELDEDAD